MDQFNHTNKLFLNQDADFASLKVMLTSGYVFDATQTAMTQATAAEVSGNGWPAGGPTLANVAVTVANTNQGRLDADDISVTASGGSIGPADGLVIYDSVAGTPLLHYAFPSAQEAGDGTPFNITWNADGIYVVAQAV